MTEFIDLFATKFESAIQHGLTIKDARIEAEIAARSTFGGERIYIASLPKQRSVVQISRMATHTQAQMAVLTGKSIRQVRRIQRGK